MILDKICHYDSVQYIRIRSTSICLLYYSLFVVIASWIVYSLISSSGHQSFCDAVASRSIKIKGVGYISRQVSNGTAVSIDPIDSEDTTTVDAMGFFIATG